MSPSKIEVGKRYRNRGAGLTERVVIEIGDFPCQWNSIRQRPKEPVVVFMQVWSRVVGKSTYLFPQKYDMVGRCKK
jgi:hypothetical protein